MQLFQGKAVKLKNEKSQAELLAECCFFLFVQTGNKVWCRVFIPVTVLQEGRFELVKLSLRISLFSRNNLTWCYLKQLYEVSCHG